MTEQTPTTPERPILRTTRVVAAPMIEQARAPLDVVLYAIRTALGDLGDVELTGLEVRVEPDELPGLVTTGSGPLRILRVTAQAPEAAPRIHPSWLEPMPGPRPPARQLTERELAAERHAESIAEDRAEGKA